MRAAVGTNKSKIHTHTHTQKQTLNRAVNNPLLFSVTRLRRALRRLFPRCFF